MIALPAVFLCYMLAGLACWRRDLPRLEARARLRLLRHRLSCPACAELEEGGPEWRRAIKGVVAIAACAYVFAWPIVCVKE